MDSIKITGRLFVTKTYADGSVERKDYTNNVMTNGKIYIAKYISGQKPVAVTQMGVGTNSTAPDPSQTALVTEIYRKDINSAVNSNNIAIIDCEFGLGEAVGYLAEAALFLEDGTMFARANINEDKGIYDQMIISWEITVN